jgi:hypothetical protein
MVGLVKRIGLILFKEEISMKLTPPKKVTFWIATVAAAVAGVAYFLHVVKVLSFDWVGPASFVLLGLAFLLLFLGLLVKGL